MKRSRFYECQLQIHQSIYFGDFPRGSICEEKQNWSHKIDNGFEKRLDIDLSNLWLELLFSFGTYIHFIYL